RWCMPRARQSPHTVAPIREYGGRTSAPRWVLCSCCVVPPLVVGCVAVGVHRRIRFGAGRVAAGGELNSLGTAHGSQPKQGNRQRAANGRGAAKAINEYRCKPHPSPLFYRKNKVK